MSMVIPYDSSVPPDYVSVPLYLQQDEDDADGGGDGVSTDTSSISLPSTTTSDGEDDDEVQGGTRKEEEEEEAFGSLDSLEDALPVKRGLSNYFNGKSKSFTSLADVITTPTHLTAEALAKPENPFNKKRRILMANRSRWPRRASCSSLNTSACLPSMLDSSNLFSLEEDDEEQDKEGGSPSVLPPLPSHMNKNKDFRSPRSFSLSNLQEYADLSSS